MEWADSDPLAQTFYPNYFRWFDMGTHKLLEAAAIASGEVEASAEGQQRATQPNGQECANVAFALTSPQLWHHRQYY